MRSISWTPRLAAGLGVESGGKVRLLGSALRSRMLAKRPENSTFFLGEVAQGVDYSPSAVSDDLELLARQWMIARSLRDRSARRTTYHLTHRCGPRSRP